MKPLRKKTLLTNVGMALVLSATIFTGAVYAGNPNSKEASAEMKWGFKAARRGYWQEALMRFEHANELTPESAADSQQHRRRPGGERAVRDGPADLPGRAFPGSREQCSAEELHAVPGVLCELYCTAGDRVKTKEGQDAQQDN